MEAMMRYSLGRKMGTMIAHGSSGGAKAVPPGGGGEARKDARREQREK